MDDRPSAEIETSSTKERVLDDAPNIELYIFAVLAAALAGFVAVLLGGLALGSVLGVDSDSGLGLVLAMVLAGASAFGAATSGHLVSEWGDRRLASRRTHGSQALMDRVTTARKLVDEVSDKASKLEQHAVVVAAEELRDDVGRVVAAENELLEFIDGVDDEARPGGSRHEAAAALLAQADEVITMLSELEAGLDELARAKVRAEAAERERARRSSTAERVPEVVLSGVTTGARARDELTGLVAGMAEVEEIESGVPRGHVAAKTPHRDLA